MGKVKIVEQLGKTLIILEAGKGKARTRVLVEDVSDLPKSELGKRAGELVAAVRPSPQNPSP